MSAASLKFLNAIALKSGKPVTLDELCAVLWDSVIPVNGKWAGLEEHYRVAFAKAAAVLLDVTQCGCRTCRTHTAVVPMLMIGGEETRALLDKAYPGRNADSAPHVRAVK